MKDFGYDHYEDLCNAWYECEPGDDDEWDDEEWEACECGREADFNCDQCGQPLCNMCSEMGANFCSKHPDDNYDPYGYT